MTAVQQARENRQYVRMLLGEREPAFAAMLRAMEWQVDQDLSRAAHRYSAHSCGRRQIMNRARLYHLDSSECIDRWSCREQDHTSVPPRCGAAVDCELPKGHPGPHSHLADRRYRTAPEAGNTAAGQGVAAAPQPEL